MPQGFLGWQEVAEMYHFRSQETVLQDHEDIKHYWAEKLCNKFKKPTGDPGDPVRDQILHCQIPAKILQKSASVVNDELSDEDEDDEEEQEEEEVEGEEQEGVIAKMLEHFKV